MLLDSSVEVLPFLSALLFLKRSLLSKQLIRSLLPVLSRLNLKKRILVRKLIPKPKLILALKLILTQIQLALVPLFSQERPQHFPQDFDLRFQILLRRSPRSGTKRWQRLLLSLLLSAAQFPVFLHSPVRSLLSHPQFQTERA